MGSSAKGRKTQTQGRGVVPPQASRFSPVTGLLLGPAIVAAVGVLAILATLGPGRGGPGVTCDEWYHIHYGKRLVAALRHQGLEFFTPAQAVENFRWRPDGPPVHPPLGNWVLGGMHHLLDPAPDNPLVVSIAAARLAPALALGLLVFLVGVATARAEGPLAGTTAAAAILLVPRAFGHGHLAALDTFTALACTAAILAVWEVERRRGAWWQFALAGVVWGLAMLTRLHGLLLGPPVVAWIVWRYGRRAAGPILAWGAAGGLTLFAGWPWLWLAPWTHFRQFLATGPGRQAIQVFYVGQTWADCDVPRHYALVMFVLALPLGLFLLGLLGVWARRRLAAADPGLVLVAGTWAFFVAVFSWPGTPVYDGVRLFLVCFPLWAVFVGIGARWIVEHPRLAKLSGRGRIALLSAWMLCQGVGLVLYCPCWLSHYSLLIGGIRGADRLGFEIDYWGDAVTETLLEKGAELAPGEPILFAPNLAPFQAPAVSVSSPALGRNQSFLVDNYHPNNGTASSCRYAVLYHRRANLADVLDEATHGEVLAEYSIQGVWMARLVAISGARRERSL